LQWITQYRGDSIAAVDNRNFRLSVLTRTGQFVRSFMLPRIPGASATNVTGTMRDGTLVLRTSVRTTPGESSHRPVIVYTVDAQGQISNQLGDFPDAALARNGTDVALGGRAVVAAGDSVIWYGHSDRFEIRAMDREGSLLRLVRMERAAHRVTEADIERARAADEQLRQRLFGPVAVAGPAMEPEFVDTHPVHGNRILVGEASDLWVARYNFMLPVQVLLSPHDVSEEWDIFDPGGRWQTTIVLPSGFQLTQVGKTFLLGVHTDELGVHRIRMYRIARE